MQTRQKKRLVRLLAAALALGLVAAACGDDGGSDNADSTGATGTGSSTGSSGTGATGTASTTTQAPVKGGVITVGEFSSAPGLDPAKMAGGGTVGGMIHAALYDNIVRYDNETGKYVPRTGEFTANADFTQWTLKLKSGIKFGDGTAYDAAAVKFVVEREMKDGNSSPKGQLLTFLDADTSKSIVVVDAQTVQFNLKLAWSDFPFLFAQAQGWIYINMNSGAPITCKGGAPAPLCTGKPDGNIPSTTATADKNVRLAVAAAVDPKVINDRVYQGAGQPDSAPFANSPWDPKVAGPKADVNEAKRLVGVAKAAGWNGKIRLLSGTDPVGTAWGEAVRLQLQAAGMEVELTNKPTSEIVNQVIVAKDYDLATWAYGMVDEFPANYVQLAGSFSAPSGRYGYSTPEMVAAVDKMRTASSQADRIAANKAVSEIWVRDMPAHVITTVMQTLVMTPKLQGAIRTAGSNVLFDKAFLAK